MEKYKGEVRVQVPADLYPFRDTIRNGQVSVAFEFREGLPPRYMDGKVPEHKKKWVRYRFFNQKDEITFYEMIEIFKVSKTELVETFLLLEAMRREPERFMPKTYVLPA